MYICRAAISIYNNINSVKFVVFILHMHCHLCDLFSLSSIVSGYFLVKVKLF